MCGSPVLRALSLIAFRAMRIYTKTGDGGTSSLYNGERRSKDDAVFEALGDVDELNSVIGVCRHVCRGMGEDGGLGAQLEEVQSRLLDVGSAVATPIPTEEEAGPASGKMARARFPEGVTERVEAWIDGLDAQLPPLTTFILPSGGAAASQLHLARTVCRRAERKVARLAIGGGVEPSVLTFMNRLSDYLFNAARFAAKAAGEEEVTYKKAAAA